ncbi:alpha-L-rhamnosidase [Microvirga zambiensis]|uniref:alpha-L-rhamnosidase n=1 Tax=Microvirga zambiensis TaxID=1402137 RepID=UPI00191D9B69|nr:alpha-L-rhamnosidase [Microvirga zambiensis]
MSDSVMPGASQLLSKYVDESQAASLRAEHLTCEMLVNPLGMDEPHPGFSWQVVGTGYNRLQSAYRIIVSDDRQTVAEGLGTHWDTGRIESDESLHIVYRGRPLSPFTRYYWTVELWDENGSHSAAAQIAWFETGLRGGSWPATWIRVPDVGPEGKLPPAGTTYDNEFSLDPCLYLRCSFTIRRPVASARLYATALGVYKASLNGGTVGDHEFAPGWTDYAKRLSYQTFDITSNLVLGDNVLAALISDGWYSGYVGYNRRKPAAHYGSKPEFLAFLRIVYEDGEVEAIGTGPHWQAGRGALVYSDFLKGEKCDATLAAPGWDRPGFLASGWRPCGAGRGTPAKLEAQREEPIRVQMEIPAVAVRAAPDGSWVFDFGQNIVGRVRLRVAAPRGTTVSIRHAEALNPDGSLYTANLRSAPAHDIYVASGESEELYEPQFTFHGFRYAAVSGLPSQPSLHAAVARVLGNDLRRTISFETSSEIINRLHANIAWSQRGNFLAVPTDCPQRDERLGWTADAQVFFHTAAYLADVSAFYRKWLIDVQDAQSKEGAFPDVAPRICSDRNGAPAWGDAGVLVPFWHYERYGDVRILRDHYASMRRWMDYVGRANPEGLRLHELNLNYGDWLSLDGTASKPVLATAYYALTAQVMAKTAEILGRAEDFAEYTRLHEKIRSSFQRAFIDAAGRVQGGTQTAYLLGLYTGMFPTELEEAAFSHLVADLEAHDWHLTTGFIGVRHLCPILTAYGRPDLAYHLVLDTTYPSWGYSIVNGATTVWERWDGWTKDRGFQTPSMNSFNHYAFGAVGEWLYGSMAGIGTAGQAGAFKKFSLSPILGKGIEWCSAEFGSPRGPIRAAWRRHPEGISYEFSIPANTTANIILFRDVGARIFLNNREIADDQDIHTVTLSLGSGNYQVNVWHKHTSHTQAC